MEYIMHDLILICQGFHDPRNIHLTSRISITQHKDTHIHTHTPQYNMSILLDLYLIFIILFHEFLNHSVQNMKIRAYFENNVDHLNG